MRAKKSLGQNFLMHQATADRIADAAGLEKTDTVLEIGPGTGMLTRALLLRAGKVVAVEADAELIPNLQEIFAQEISDGRLQLIHGDIRTFDTAPLTKPYKLVANIPYYLTGEIIRQFLTADHKPTSMTLLVQREVANRIAREKKESILSVSVKVFGTPKYQFTVPRGAFVPSPNVDSAVLSIEEIKSAFASAGEEKGFFELLHAGFAHKRKLLARNLEAIAPKGAIQAAFSALSIPEKARAEDIQTPQWRALFLRLEPTSLMHI